MAELSSFPAEREQEGAGAPLLLRLLKRGSFRDSIGGLQKGARCELYSFQLGVVGLFQRFASTHTFQCPLLNKEYTLHHNRDATLIQSVFLSQKILEGWGFFLAAGQKWNLRYSVGFRVYRVEDLGLGVNGCGFRV